ncbi:MAG: peroxide stress protein YaaA [Propionibacteriaceae bacterium]|nr:peroxide stress protein YaaA [Propionibacteriaceae bacterium]
MLALLSPAKSLDFESPLPFPRRTQPRMLEESAGLIDVMREKSVAEIAKLMHISEELSTLNASRYAAYDDEHTRKNSRPAALAFNGDVYQGMQASQFDARDFTEAQKTLRILSGLYGVLRPLDVIQPHRMEMGTKLKTARGKTLYKWWGSRVTDQLKADLDESPGTSVIVNLASNEYFGVVDTDRLGARVISPRFEDRDEDGKPRIVSFHAKRARGLMASWLVRNRVRTASAVTDFEADGYIFDPTRSTKDTPIFVR